ncbi:MAG: porin [Polaromonas sp.]
MKKSLIALAALAATSAFAQSSVTLYGIVEATVDVGYNRKVDTTTSTSFTNTNGTANGNSTVISIPTLSATTGALTAGAAVNGGTVAVRNEQKNGFRVQDGNDQGSGTSRVGFRGTEDLGGGMKANFLMEMGIRVDDGAITNGSGNVASSGASGGNAFGRNAWGGLSGGFGEVRLGRQVLGSFGVQANSWSAGSSNGLYDAGSGTAPLMGGVRFSNAIRYMTPDFGGFKGSLMLAAPETEGNTSANSTATPINTGVGIVTSSTASVRTGVDLALEYANGPAYVGFGYNTRNSANETGGFTGIGALAGVGNTVVNNPGRVNAWTLGGSYDLGVVKPFINYTRQTTKSDRMDTFSPAAGGFASSVSNINDVNVRAWSIGLRAPVGAFTIIAGYGRAVTDGLNNVVGTQNVAAQSNVTNLRIANSQTRNAFQLGATYALSKRTSLQANYGYNRLQNNTDAVSTSNFLAASGVQTIRSTDRVSALNVGLKHSF